MRGAKVETSKRRVNQPSFAYRANVVKMKPMVAPRSDAPRPSPRQIARYIKDVQSQLATMAEAAELPVLAALCRGAALEAARSAHRHGLDEDAA